MIIITRINATPGDKDTTNFPDEFCAYWNGKENQSYLDFQNSDCSIRVINGPYFYRGDGAPEEWKKEGSSEQNVNTYFSLIKNLLKVNGNHLGVIFHPPTGFKIGKKIKDSYTNLKFCKPYSQTESYYEPIYKPLAQSCENSTIGKPDLFEELWNIFYGDPVLEAKLELLHACLAPEGLELAEKEYEKLEKDGQLNDAIKTAFDNMKNEMNKENADCFNEQYLKKLEGLRNTLL